MLASASQGANPVIPASWEFIVIGIGVLALLLFVLALIGIARASHLTGAARAVWVLAVLAFPFAGPILWFLIGRRANTPGREGGSSRPSSTTVRSSRHGGS